MSPLTERLLTLDPTLRLHNEGEWSSTISAYSAFNSGGVECEVGEFLYGLIRMIRPDYVLETGTHLGIGASYMGFALKDNFEGHLETIEYIPEIHKEAVARIHAMGLDEFVKPYLLDVKDFPVQHPYQLILLDTEPQTRFAEFLKFYPHLAEGGYMFIHDLGRGMCQGNTIPSMPDFHSWPFGDLPDTMKQWEKEGKIKRFHFATPRGFTGFYKTHHQDFDVLKGT